MVNSWLRAAGGVHDCTKSVAVELGEDWHFYVTPSAPASRQVTVMYLSVETPRSTKSPAKCFLVGTLH